MVLQARRAWMSWLDSLERMSATRANTRASMALDVFMPLALIAASPLIGQMRVLPALLVALAGLLLFTWVEYVFHRWIFHGTRTLGAFRQGHWNHHQDPHCDASLPFFLPPAIILIIAALLSFAMPTDYAVLLAGSIASGYACYDVCHHLIHARRFRQPSLRALAANHHIHHYHPDRNFGVTTPLWDYVLGTRHVSVGRRAFKT